MSSGSNREKSVPDFIHFPIFAPLDMFEGELGLPDPVIRAAINRLDDRRYHRFHAAEIGDVLCVFDQNNNLARKEMRIILVLVRDHLIGFLTFPTCAKAIAQYTTVSRDNASELLKNIHSIPIKERTRNTPQTSQLVCQMHKHMLRFWYGVQPVK